MSHGKRLHASLARMSIAGSNHRTEFHKLSLVQKILRCIAPPIAAGVIDKAHGAVLPCIDVAHAHSVMCGHWSKKARMVWDPVKHLGLSCSRFDGRAEEEQCNSIAWTS